MLQWIANHLSTVLVGLGLLAVVCLIIAKMVSDRRKGKTSCGCGGSTCDGCCGCSHHAIH